MSSALERGEQPEVRGGPTLDHLREHGVGAADVLGDGGDGPPLGPGNPAVPIGVERGDDASGFVLDGADVVDMAMVLPGRRRPGIRAVAGGISTVPDGSTTANLSARSTCSGDREEQGTMSRNRPQLRLR